MAQKENSSIYLEENYEEKIDYFKSFFSKQSDELLRISEDEDEKEKILNNPRKLDVMLSLDDILNIESKKSKSRSKTSELDINMV